MKDSSLKRDGDILDLILPPFMPM